jgi:hypothetical protein
MGLRLALTAPIQFSPLGDRCSIKVIEIVQGGDKTSHWSAGVVLSVAA